MGHPACKAGTNGQMDLDSVCSGLTGLDQIRTAPTWAFSPGYHMAGLRPFRNPPPIHSIPRVTFVRRLAILLTKTTELGLKILLPVVVRLMANVISDRFNMHWTNAELAVTSLPCEIRIPRM